MTSVPQMKRQELVQGMFDRIATRYDLLNRVISFHLDTRWRKKVVGAIDLKSSERLVLDLGTGTGDLALTAANLLRSDVKIFGLDFSLEMLRRAQMKKAEVAYGHKSEYVLGTALAAPFRSETFDAVMTAFVLRNVSDLSLFFLQAYRLLKPGGRLVTLDMFPPKGTPFAFFYSFYFYRLVPWIGGFLAGDRSAYRYLSESVRNFDSPAQISQVIRQAGFGKVKIESFLQGAVCLHVGEKPYGPAK